MIHDEHNCKGLENDLLQISSVIFFNILAIRPFVKGTSVRPKYTGLLSIRTPPSGDASDRTHACKPDENLIKFRNIDILV